MLYEMATDQNVDTTQHDPIHYSDLLCWPTHSHLNFHQTSELLYEKQVVSLLNTLNCYIIK